MSSNTVTFEEQLRLLQGIKSVVEDIRFNIKAHLIAEPREILTSLRASGFTMEAADNYEKRFLDPDIASLTELDKTVIEPTIAYLDNQIASIRDLLSHLS